MGFALSDDSGLVSIENDKQTDAVIAILFDTSKQPEISLMEIDEHCLNVAAERGRELLVNPEELVPGVRLLQRINSNLIAVTFNRKIGNLQVRDGIFQCIYTGTGSEPHKLREITNRTYGGIALENSSAGDPEFNRVALATGRDLELIEQRALIFPNRETTGDITLWHAIEFKTLDRNSDERITITVRIDDGAVLEAFSNRYAATYDVTGDLFDRTYLNSTRKPVPVPLLEVIDGANALSADVDGELISTTLGTSLSVRLQGARARVVNTKVSVTDVMTVPAALNGDNQIKLNPDANGLIGLSAYAATIKINEFVRRHLEPSQAVILGQPITLSINVTGSCNAFYNGNISLFDAGNGCQNTALVNDIIYHEWGHGLDDDTGTNPGITDGAFSEGIGDILASFFTGDANLAPGFLSDQVPGIRNMVNNKRYPTDQGEVHIEGQIVGAAFWDMRVALINRYGRDKGAYLAETYFFKHLLTTDSYLNSYTAVIRLDDDDNNPATRSANYCLINAAFSARGIATVDNCTDTVTAEKTTADLNLALNTGSSNTFLGSGRDIHFLHLCFGNKLSCLINARIDVKLERSGTIGDLAVFVNNANQQLAANTLITVVGSDEYGTVKSARSFKIMNR